MNKNRPDMNYKTPVPYGPATGKEDPGRQPVIADTPYEGDYSPDHSQGTFQEVRGTKIVSMNKER